MNPHTLTEESTNARSTVGNVAVSVVAVVAVVCCSTGLVRSYCCHYSNVERALAILLSPLGRDSYRFFPRVSSLIINTLNSRISLRQAASQRLGDKRTTITTYQESGKRPKNPSFFSAETGGARQQKCYYYLFHFFLDFSPFLMRLRFSPGWEPRAIKPTENLMEKRRILNHFMPFSPNIYGFFRD